MNNMSLKQDGYKERLIDKKIDEYLKIFGAISIVGPKWCGKTWTSLAHANTVKYINSEDKKLLNLAKRDVNQILIGDYPILIDDLNTFGFLFEALVERDLRIYSNYNEGELRHFRNNVTGLEVDSIVINEDRKYGAIEIKLGANQIDEAKETLLKFYDKADKKPKFMCIICGLWGNVVKDPETGIYIIPITALKP